MVNNHRLFHAHSVGDLTWDQRDGFSETMVSWPCWDWNPVFIPEPRSHPYISVSSANQDEGVLHSGWGLEFPRSSGQAPREVGRRGHKVCRHWCGCVWPQAKSQNCSANNVLGVFFKHSQQNTGLKHALCCALTIQSTSSFCNRDFQKLPVLLWSWAGL